MPMHFKMDLIQEENCPRLLTSNTNPFIMGPTWRRKMSQGSGLNNKAFKQHPGGLVPYQDVHFFYMRSHLSALQNRALNLLTNF